MSTTIWGYPATLRLQLKDGYSLAIEDFLKWSDVGNAPSLDLDAILDAVAEAEKHDYRPPATLPRSAIEQGKVCIYQEVPLRSYNVGSASAASGGAG